MDMFRVRVMHLPMESVLEDTVNGEVLTVRCS